MFACISYAVFCLKQKRFGAGAGTLGRHWQLAGKVAYSRVIVFLLEANVSSKRSTKYQHASLVPWLMDVPPVMAWLWLIVTIGDTVAPL